MGSSHATRNSQGPSRSLWRRLRPWLVPRISLRIFFVLLTLLCMGLGALTIWRERAVRQRIACEQLEKLEWYVAPVESQYTEEKLSSWFRALPKWAREGDASHFWFGVDRIHAYNRNLLAGSRTAAMLPHVREIEFESETDLTPEICQAIGDIRNVKSLIFRDTFIDDAGLEQIAKITNLQSLDLANTKISSKGVRHLSKLRHLKSLNLSNANIDDNALAVLGGLSRLEELNLFRTNVTSQGLSHLTSLRQLKSLDLEGTLIDDQAAHTLTGFHRLEVLNLSDCDLSDSAIAKVLKHPALWHVSLANTNAGPQSLRALAALPKLTDLKLFGAMLKPGELKLLSAANKLSSLQAPQTTPLDELLGIHNHPSLQELYLGGEFYPLDDLKILSGAPSTAETFSISSLTLSPAQWNNIASANNLESLHIDHCNLDDLTLRAFAKLDKLKRLYISSNSITDASLVEIAKIQNLELLSIDNAQITDAGLPVLGSLKKLKEVSFANCDKLTEASLPLMLSFPSLSIINAADATRIDPPLLPAALVSNAPGGEKRLEEIEWGSICYDRAELDILLNRPIDTDNWSLEPDHTWRLSPRQLKLISEASHLRNIEVDGPGLLDQDFRHLGLMPELIDVRISDVQLGPHAAKWIAAQTGVGYLHLTNVEMSDEAAKALAASNEITFLYMNNVTFQGNALRSIAQMPHLHQLTLNACRFDEADLDEFASATFLDSLEITQHALSSQSVDSLVSKIPKLQSITLNQCGLKPEIVEILAKHGKNLTSIDLSNNEIKLEHFRDHLLHFPNLTWLSMAPETEQQYFDAEFDKVRLNWIRWDLQRNQGIAAPLPQVEPLDSRWSHHFGRGPLQIGNRWIGNDLAIAMLQAHPKTHYLNVSRGPVSRPLLQELAKTDHVVELDLSHSKISDNDLHLLRQLTRLRNLSLAGCEITDRGAECIAQNCPNLTELDLSSTEISGAALAHLAKLRFLAKLDVSRTEVDINGLHALRDLKHLSSVFIYETKVTPQDLQNLGPRANQWILYHDDPWEDVDLSSGYLPKSPGASPR